MTRTSGVRCWGYNYYGQLGDGTTTDRYNPPSSDVLTGVSQIAAGYLHTCAVMSGTHGVRCWGYNGYGQLGDGTTNNLSSPPSNDVLTGVLQIAAGYGHTCVLMSDTYGVRCWGYNAYGQLGDGTTNNLFTPPSNDVLTGVLQIGVGDSHTCALMSEANGVRCWGYNDYGQLGDGSTTILSIPPGRDILTGVSRIAVGYFHTCALMSGTYGVRCWGVNGNGQLGDGTTNSVYSPPSSDILTGVKQIAAGEYHTCVLMSGTGGVRCWGDNEYGQLGDGSTSGLESPPSNDVLTKVSQIAAGESYTCVLMSGTGGVQCWGQNDYGQLGDGSTTNLQSPPSNSIIFP